MTYFSFFKILFLKVLINGIVKNKEIEQLAEIINGKRIEELSEQFALDTVLQRKAGKLSGGWQRRVSIAMALISEPEILFLDEPTLGLDVIVRSDLWDIIRALKGHITIILTTHYMEEATEADYVVILDNGKTTQIDHIVVTVCGVFVIETRNDF